MYLLRKLRRQAMAALAATGTVAACHAAALAKSGEEYRFIPSLPGDQMMPNLALNERGGYLVTQDNSIDGNGLGIRARKFYADLSGSRWTFQVNAEGLGEQQNAKVAVFANGGAIFVWQGSTPSGNRVFVRVLDASETFRGPETQVSANPSGNQIDPAVAVLADGTAVVVWDEWNRDGSMNGIFAQRFSASGERIGPTFQVNQAISAAQRSPAITALANGNFAIVWVQEFSGMEAIPVYGRIYRADGLALGGAFRLNNAERICANPSVVAVGNGFRAAWSSRRPPQPGVVDPGDREGFRVTAEVNVESWDVVSRAFAADGTPAGDDALLNNVTMGDQFSPKLVSTGSKVLAVWTSYGQDGADEGIFGRMVSVAGPEESEFLINTRTISKQRQPTIGRLGETVVVVWTSFMGGLESYDLFAQNFRMTADTALSAPAVPFVSSLSANSICVTWAEQVSLNVDKYLIYVDDEAVPEQSSNGMHIITRNWAPKSTHTIRLAFRTADGRISPASAPVTVTTFGPDLNGDGLPDDWQTENWGKKWPGAHEDSDGDGATNLEEFLAGTDPTDPASVLKVQISPREQGLYLQWNTQAGSFYRLQVTTDFGTWTDVGAPRFAPSNADAVPITVPGQVQYYRVIRMR